MTKLYVVDGAGGNARVCKGLRETEAVVAACIEEGIAPNKLKVHKVFKGAINFNVNNSVKVRCNA